MQWHPYILILFRINYFLKAFAFQHSNLHKFSLSYPQPLIDGSDSSITVSGRNQHSNPTVIVAMGHAQPLELNTPDLTFKRLWMCSEMLLFCDPVSGEC